MAQQRPAASFQGRGDGALPVGRDAGPAAATTVPADLRGRVARSGRAGGHLNMTAATPFSCRFGVWYAGTPSSWATASAVPLNVDWL